jgi:enoyl-CoA hydratase/carnithine racemase
MAADAPAGNRAALTSCLRRREDRCNKTGEDAVSDAPAVLFELAEPHIALVTLNRPEARNAVNGAVAEALEAAVARIEADPDLWAAVLTGAGPHAFCAGADLKEVSAGRSASLARERGGFAGFVRAPRSKLWIAAAQGHALAGGLELLLACDLAIGAETATFGLPEVKRSLVAGAGGVFRLPRALPKAIALQMIATGEPISAALAHHYGLLNAVVPQDQVLGAALALARKICANAPVAVRESLATARRAADLDEAALWQLCRDASARIRLTEDFQEGPRAFVEKRAPRWTGR